MELAEYIKEYGEKKFAKDFKLSPQSVWRYKTYRQAPRIDLAVKIVQKSKGFVNFNQIYGPFYLKTKKLSDLQFPVLG